LLLEEEVKRGRTIAEQAALDQRILADKLHERTNELEKRSLQLKQFVDCVSVGISVLEFGPEFLQGRYAYRNDRWWELMAGSKAEEEHLPVGATPIWQRIHQDDIQQTRERWQELMLTRSSSNCAFRIARRKDIRSPTEADYRWLLSSSLSVLDSEGRMISVITSVTDITPQKQAEYTQKRLAFEAIEAKRQQENFIDITSHEMRNPLSAIMISADDIMSSLKSLEQRFPDSRVVLRSAVDAAQVIVDCAQHQRRIVDDILTISKLDSGLFSFAPVACSVATVINNLLKMIEPELASGGVSRHLDIDPSFQILAIDQVFIDPSRLLQILINLLTNAVKFTKHAELRSITICMRASLVPPLRTMHGHEYLPRHRQHDHASVRTEWKVSDILYLEFSIEDTGKGLTPEEKDLMFQRFSQAPKTHVNYGGSGLGLFISRELVELQGGQIGVASEGQGKGCNFSFYIQARRASASEVLAAVANGYVPSHNEAQSMYDIRSALDYEHMDIDLTTPGIGSPLLSPLYASTATHKPKHALIVEDNLVNVSESNDFMLHKLTAP
jgi:signal transduction histidine kinase